MSIDGIQHRCSESRRSASTRSLPAPQSTRSRRPLRTSTRSRPAPARTVLRPPRIGDPVVAGAAFEHVVALADRRFVERVGRLLVVADQRVVAGVARTAGRRRPRRRAGRRPRAAGRGGRRRRRPDSVSRPPRAEQDGRGRDRRRASPRPRRRAACRRRARPGRARSPRARRRRSLVPDAEVHGHARGAGGEVQRVEPAAAGQAIRRPVPPSIVSGSGRTPTTSSAPAPRVDVGREPAADSASPVVAVAERQRAGPGSAGPGPAVDRAADRGRVDRCAAGQRRALVADQPAVALARDRDPVRLPRLRRVITVTGIGVPAAYFEHAASPRQESTVVVADRRRRAVAAALKHERRARRSPRVLLL